MEVQLALKTLRKLLDDFRGLHKSQGRLVLLNLAGQELHNLQIDHNVPSDAWPLHLDEHLGAVLQHRVMPLRDGSSPHGLLVK